MSQPTLSQSIEWARRWRPSREAVAALAADLARALGPDQVDTTEAARRAASVDFAHMSPLLTQASPSYPADLVVRPRTADDVHTALGLAHTHRVPVVARGAGTGNYGQAIPLGGGLVLDMRRLDRILDIGPGRVRAEAGATFVAMQALARRRGQELAMLPTTVGSTLGGFVAGGAGGVGSLEHGFLWEGFVISLDVVGCPPGSAQPATVYGAQCLPYLHAYGVSGIIVAATVRLVPWVERVSVFCSFDSSGWREAAQAGLDLMAMTPTPRLISLDEAELAATFPTDPAIPAHRHSLRVLVDSTGLARLRGIVRSHGGRVEEVRQGGPSYLSSLAFNHVTLRAQRVRPELCHLQVSGEALLTRTAEVRDAVPGALLHLDGLRMTLDPTDPVRGRHYGGLLLSPYRDSASLYRGIAALRDLGVHVVDPHTWLLGGPALADIRAAASRNDPAGLLNPGKLPPPPPRLPC